MSDEEERRPPWFLITGLVLGIVLGLVYAWYASPVQYSGGAPAELKPVLQDQYRRLVALAYAANGDIGRARARLALLDDPDPSDSLADLAQEIVAQGGSPDEARALAALSAAVKDLPFVVEVNLPVETPTWTENPTLSPTPAAGTLQPVSTATEPVQTETVMSTSKPIAPQAASTTPRPTQTASPTPGAPFVLADNQTVCEEGEAELLLQVQAVDSAGQAIHGAQVVVTWEGGQDIFYTGLAPEISPGYADFAMQTSQSYSVRVGDGGEAVGGLAAPECKRSDGSKFWGGVRLRFRQP